PVSKRANRIPPALTVVLPHEQSHPLVDSLTRAGLDVDAVDVWVAAAARICRRLMPPAPALTLILDIGASASRIALTCGDWVLAMREIPEAALSRDLPAGQVPAVIDTVAAELNSSLAYAQQQFPDHAVEQLLVVGHGASAPGVMESLAEGFAIPVIRATPQSLIAADPEASEAQASPAFTLAIGAARFGEAA
ncbi:MAG TPA: hypothetical protein PKB10_00030, partial [Tepidisphaeraceae bacterium]|nr:hypothetical protein [Tepidisphaeraceae bacterium]